MIQDNEVIMLVLSLGILAFMFINYFNLKRLPSFKILTTAYCIFMAGWALTVLEGFFWNETLNFFEHTCYAIGAVFMAAWFLNVFAKPKGNK